MSSVNVWETFASIQGETTYAGMPCHFIRLAGCNLRCRYCDTPEAYAPGEPVDIDRLVEDAALASCPLVEITGGEPLLQPGFSALAAALLDRTGKTVLVETNGSLDVSVVPEGVVTIMDFKCPGSGESNAMDPGNLGRLRMQDEVKFVIGDRADYDWARTVTDRHNLENRCHAVLFTPVFDELDAGELAGWMMRDGLNVRLQVQLHKLIGME